MAFKVAKPKDKKPSFLRSSSSSASKPTRNQRQQVKRAVSQIDADSDYAEKLDDIGPVQTLGHSLPSQDILQAITYIKNNMFDEIPAQRSGMNGARIAEVLNFRKNLPPIVTNVHVHALIDAPTQVEREIGRLVTEGSIKRVIVPGRGVGASAISDALVVVSDWVERVEASTISSELKGKDNDTSRLVFLISLGKYSHCLTSKEDVNQQSLSQEETTDLVHAGFLTSASVFGTASNTANLDIKGLSRSAISVHNIARAASGSLNAIGGEGAIYRIGGGGTSGLKPTQDYGLKNTNFRLSLPNIGSYLKLLQSAREHLLGLLSKSRYSEAPLYLLKERWDGGISTKNPYGRSKDPFKMILPGKTKKWKEFYGLNFDWVLAECLGGGLIELFNTRSVGLGVRLT